MKSPFPVLLPSPRSPYRAGPCLSHSRGLVCPFLPPYPHDKEPLLVLPPKPLPLSENTLSRLPAGSGTPDTGGPSAPG